MKGVEVYHAVKALRKSGRSYREIASVLSISKSTVQRYLQVPLSEVSEQLTKVKRRSVLDPFRSQYEEIVFHRPKIRASKLYVKFQQDNPDVQISSRSFRKFIRRIKDSVSSKGQRYYSVVNYEAGVQMQVDPGEMSLVSRSGEKLKVYFVVFILCYSRHKYVYFQNRPFNTNDFISAHQCCFDYLGYLPQQMIYDQTKLVVIREKYREVWFNQRFYRFISQLEISPYVCEGYDPQSKGMVERAVQEVKYDFLYTEDFLDIEQIKSRSLSWLEAVNNKKHSTTGESPSVLFALEQKLMRPYISKRFEERKVDKVGLISWRGNKYSVPYFYQQKKVLVRAEDEFLYIADQKCNVQIASHKISHQKGVRIINNNHYRDYDQLLSDLKQELLAYLDSYENSHEFIEKLVESNPQNPRDQLRAVRKFYRNNEVLDWNIVIKKALNFSQLRASKIELLVEETKRQDILSRLKNSDEFEPSIVPSSSLLQRDLSEYDKVRKR